MQVVRRKCMKKRFVVPRNMVFRDRLSCARNSPLETRWPACHHDRGEAEEVTMKGRGGRAERAGRPTLRKQWRTRNVHACTQRMSWETDSERTSLRYESGESGGFAALNSKYRGLNARGGPTLIVVGRRILSPLLYHHTHVMWKRVLRRYYEATQEIAAATGNNSGEKRKDSLHATESSLPLDSY